MVRGVNQQTEALRAQRVADTEARLIDAARDLFAQHGYFETTLAAVARTAGVAERTVYLRFGTKAALFSRVFDVTLAGDTEDRELAQRDWIEDSLRLPTLDERIAARARGVALMFERIGPLLPVFTAAQAVEPLIAERGQAARLYTHREQVRFWRHARDDGLLRADADLEWLAHTSTFLSGAETYLSIARITGWSRRRYERWFIDTYHRLASAAEGATAGSNSGRRR